MTSQQLAIALSLCKSKPDHLSVREYILSLRKYISTNQIDSGKPRFDPAKYWKDLYKASELEKSTVKVRLQDLQREFDLLSTARPTNPPTTDKTAKKRSSTVACGTTMYEPAVKRTKTVTVEQCNELLNSIESFDEVTQVSKRTKGGDAAAVCFYQLRKLYLQDPVDCALLAKAVVETCNQLSKNVIDFIHHQLFTERTTTVDREKTVQIAKSLPKVHSAKIADIDGHFHVAIRLFTSTLLGLNRLNGGDEGQKYVGSVIYALVFCFKAILDLMRTITKSLVENDDIASSGAVEPSTSKRKPKSASKGKIHPHLLQSITTLLNSMLLNLTAGDNMHRDLFEGYTFVVFERVAQILYFFTFGYERKRSIEEDIAASVNEASASSRVSSDELLIKRAMKLEAPYLTPLLERCCSLIPLHFDMPSNPRPSRAKSTKSGRSSIKIPTYTGKAAVGKHIRERLQQTLVSCMFGEGDRKQDEFLDCLRMPAKTVPAPSPKNLKDKENVEEWFKEEIWRILGWEILMAL